MEGETKMKPRERVEMALNHEKPDRTPMQISFTPEFAERLRKDLHVKGKATHNPHGGGNTYELERAIGEDMLLTSVGWANSYYMADQLYR
jgi:uroporphyrinogen decarboxylase